MQNNRYKNYVSYFYKSSKFLIAISNRTFSLSKLHNFDSTLFHLPFPILLLCHLFGWLAIMNNNFYTCWFIRILHLIKHLFENDHIWSQLLHKHEFLFLEILFVWFRWLGVYADRKLWIIQKSWLSSKNEQY